MQYFDAHCHIQFEHYDADREAVVARMVGQGVGGLVVGTGAQSSKAAVVFVAGREGMYASVGLHPNHATDEVFDELAFRALVARPGVVAIGECGLDYFRPVDANDDVKRTQKELFERHVRLAGETKLPLIVHARPSKGTMDAYDDALAIIRDAKKEFGDLRGDVHFFVGDVQVAKQVFELDFTVSYTAVLTFTHDYDEVIRYAPLSHLLTETDSPYVAPASRRGQRNDPCSVIDVVGALAQVRGVDEEMVREAVLQNAQTLFRLGQG